MMMDNYAFEWGDGVIPAGKCQSVLARAGRRFRKTAASPVKDWHLELQQGIKRVSSS